MNRVSIKNLIRAVLKEGNTSTSTSTNAGRPANAPFAKKVSLVFDGLKLPALISKNTRSGEEEFRISWFNKVNGEWKPIGHLPMDDITMYKMVMTHHIPPNLLKYFKLLYPTKKNIRLDMEPTPLNEQTLSEGMSVYIKGVDDAYKRTDLLNDLGNHLLDKVVSPILHKMPTDQQEYFKRNSVGFYNLLVPDGSYYDGNQSEGKTGTLNFYTAGIVTQPLKEILKGLFIELRRMQVKWGKISKGQSGAYKSQVIRIPIKNNPSTYDGPPEIHMSNSNAYHIFHNVLGFSPEDDSNSSFSMKVSELKESILGAMKDHGWISQNLRPDWDSHNPSVGGEHDGAEIPPNPHDDIIRQIGKKLGGDEETPEYGDDEESDDNDSGKGAHIISHGLGENSIRSRLTHLLKICEWAEQNHKTDIYVA